MRPGSDPEDIHTILNRFQNWAGKEPGNANGKSPALESDSVREVPYEEAMRHFQERHKTHPRRVVRAPAEPAPPAEKAPPERAAAATPKQESAPVIPVPPAEAAPLATPRQAEPEPAPQAQRFPAFVTNATPAAQPSEKKKKKKPVTQKKKASAEPPVPAQPSAPATRKKPVLSRPPSRRFATKKKAPLTAMPRATAPKTPEFRKVLAKTVRSGDTPTSSAADRNRRITTRFSSSEERRLERAAEQAGLTVSAWLRQCALRAEAASAPPHAPASRSKAKKQAVPSPPAASTLFSSAAPSRVGWLTLLRQRFLSSHARFSERA